MFAPEVADLEFGLSPVSEMPPDEFNVSLRELHSRCGNGVSELKRCGRDSDTEEREYRCRLEKLLMLRRCGCEREVLTER